VGTFPNLYCSSNSFLTSTAMPVGSFPSGESPYGADDLAGNAREWVADWYAAILSSTAATDPRGPDVGTQKIARGGNYQSQETDLYMYLRPTRDPWLANEVIGFRCASGTPRLTARLDASEDVQGAGVAINFDASRSSGPNSPVGMQVRWDWTSDGTYDTAWSTSLQASHAFATQGLYRVTLQVKDAGGLIAVTSRGITVTGAGFGGSPCVQDSNCFPGYSCDLSKDGCYGPCGAQSACPTNQTCTSANTTAGTVSLCE
jgi:hypothetical protein